MAGKISGVLVCVLCVAASGAADEGLVGHWDFDEGRGEERIITKKDGIYGWHGDRSLHLVYLHDARGRHTRSNFATTVGPGAAGVRTELKLAKDQMAVVAKLPLTLTTSGPVNLNVRRYDRRAVRIALNGRGDITLRVGTGDFAIAPGASYQVRMNGRAQRIAASADGALSVPLTLDGPTTVEVKEK